jgi:peptidoglycan/LPS O-acetylase OafA/YrhL
LLFVFGMAAARYYVGRDRLAVFGGSVVTVALAITATGAVLTAAVGLGASLFILFVKAPSWPILTGFGTISYSLYLIHVPIGGRVVNLGKRFVHGWEAELAMSACALALSLVAAWLWHRAFEAPATRLMSVCPPTSAATPWRRTG